MNDLILHTSCNHLFISFQQNFQFPESITGLSFGKLKNVHRWNVSSITIQETLSDNNTSSITRMVSVPENILGTILTNFWTTIARNQASKSTSHVTACTIRVLKTCCKLKSQFLFPNDYVILGAETKKQNFTNHSLYSSWGYLP